MSDGFKTLAEGQRVTFDISQGAKGLQAENIRAYNFNTSEESIVEQLPEYIAIALVEGEIGSLQSVKMGNLDL